MEKTVKSEEELVLRDKLVKEVNSIKRIALITVFTGLVFLSTSIFYVYIPTSNGFFNIGEVFIYLAALIGGPITGAIAGGLGASMADLALFFGHFAPGTAVIKAIEGFVVGLLFFYSKRFKKWVKYVFVGILCTFLIVFSAFFVNQDIEFGMSLYGTNEFVAIIPGYSLLIIALILSGIIIAVLFFLKEKGEMALACSIGGTLMVLGYFLYEIVVLSYPVGSAASELPFNFAQAIFGAALSIPIVSYLSDLGILRSKKEKMSLADKIVEEGIVEEKISRLIVTSVVDMLQVTNLTVKYSNLIQPSLKSINFEAVKGEFIVIAGNSGSGKSTLAQALMTLIPYFTEASVTGEIKYNGKLITELERKDLIGILGFVPQYPSDFTTTLLVEEEVAFALENLALDQEEIKQRLSKIFKELDIEHLRQKVFTEISSGELQRVFLASALAFAPPIIILDEPIARIDPKTEIKLVSILRELANNGHLVIAFEHRLDYILSEADRLIILDEGKITNDDKPINIIHYLEKIDPPEISLIKLPDEQKIFSLDKIDNKHKLQFKDLESKNLESFTKEISLTKIKNSASFNEIKFRYNKKQSWILNNISLDLQQGQAIGLMGINGSGKSTLLKTLSGILKVKEGEIKVKEKTIKRVRNAKKSILFLPENAKLFLVGPTPLADLRRELKDPALVIGLYKKLKLSRLLDRKLYHLSEGERRLIAIVNAFQFHDELILLDEPTIALDKTGRNILLQLISEAKANGQTVIVASNDPRIVSFLDRIVVIKDGKICLEGDPRDVLYKLEERTELVPNQTVRLIQTLEQELQIQLPHYLTPSEINEELRRLI